MFDVQVSSRRGHISRVSVIKGGGDY